MTGEIERFAFAAMKYGVALPADAGRIEAWRGFVTDDRAHQLDFHELLFVDDGRGQIWLDEQRAAIAPGRLLLTPAGRVRRFELDRPLEGFILLFTRGLSQHIAADMLGGRTFRCLSASAPMPVRDETAARIRRLLDDMGREVSLQAPDAAAMLTAQLAQLLLLLDRECPSAAPRTSEPPLVARLRALVEAHHRRQHRPSFYATQLGVTTDHLGAVVRAATGLTTSELIARRVVREARRRLLHTTRPVAAIAGDLGFADESYFSRTFRRTAGCSPSAFRRQIAEKHR